VLAHIVFFGMACLWDLNQEDEQLEAEKAAVHELLKQE